MAGCLLVTACGAQQEQLRAGDVSALQSATARSGPSTASTPSPVESPAPPVPVQPSASDSPPPAVAPAPSPIETSRPDHGAALWNTQWRAVDRTKGGQPWPFPAEAAWTARFESETARVIAWRGGCNTTGAAVAVSADRLSVGEPEGSTAVGCPDDRLEEDEQAGAFFMSDPTWSLRGDELLLTSVETSVRLVRTSE